MSRARRSPRRRWPLVALVLVAVAAGTGWLLRPAVDVRTDSAVPSAVPSAAPTGGSPASASSGTVGGAVPDPRATETAPVRTEPPEDVVIDEPPPVAEDTGTVVLTSAEWDTGNGWVRVRAYLPGLVEDGGTCTLTLTRGADVRTATADGMADASTTICGRLTVPGDQLRPGEWQAVVTYASAGVSGSSDAAEVNVP